jgi:predicted lactoylglutathione lyase
VGKNLLKSVEIKVFLPARDFEISKRFYEAIGFVMEWSTEGLACFGIGGSRFLLQNFYVKEQADNFKMHWLVEDVDGWWEQISKGAAGFGISVERPSDKAWGMRDFPLVDPSGVLWRIGEVLEAGRE